jgi:hypothetical protein
MNHSIDVLYVVDECGVFLHTIIISMFLYYTDIALSERRGDYFASR